MNHTEEATAAFKKFCLDTGRQWEYYGNVPMMWEFAQWYHLIMVRDLPQTRGER